MEDKDELLNKEWTEEEWDKLEDAPPLVLKHDRKRFEKVLLLTFVIGYLGGFVNALILMWLTP